MVPEASKIKASGAFLLHRGSTVTYRKISPLFLKTVRRTVRKLYVKTYVQCRSLLRLGVFEPPNLRGFVLFPFVYVQKKRGISVNDIFQILNTKQPTKYYKLTL